MYFENRLTQKQNQVITTKQIQSLDILACTNQEIDRLLREEFLTNPILEYSLHKDSTMSNAESSYGNYSSTGIRNDEGTIKEIPYKEKKTISDDLKEQLNTSKYTKNQYEILMVLLNYLEDDGFFPYNIEELSNELRYDIDDLSYCLNELKKLEPIGIFSKNIEECLITQLIHKGILDQVLFELIQNYTNDILNGNIGKITKEMGISSYKLKEYIKLIRTLNPKPIMQSYSEDIEYIIPDIIIRRIETKWEIVINDGWIGDYTYNNYYIKLMKETEDNNLVEYFKQNYERAKFMITCVEQRRNTLIKIMEAILERQNDFFLLQDNLKPMRLTDIANDIGVHVSTVSRAIKGKYLQYKKVVLVKDLFQGAMIESSGEVVTSEYIKEAILQLIQEEDKVLSDNQIASILNEKGIQVSRRTVAKYRVEMNILDSSQRKLLK